MEPLPLFVSTKCSTNLFEIIAAIVRKFTGSGTALDTVKTTARLTGTVLFAGPTAKGCGGPARPRRSRP